MPKKQLRFRRASVWVLVFAGVIAAMGYGIAQNTVVTQAEWAVYMVRALSLDWNLPSNPKSNHYIDRLNWQSGIEFEATSLEMGSSPFIRVGEGYIESEAPSAEALYRVSTIRPGDYMFRLRLADGGAVVKVGNAVFEAYQPQSEFRWVDLSRISLDPGDHTLHVLLSEGARTERVGVTPPCLISVEPQGGWQPLRPLNYADLAVTVAKALELEYDLDPLGSEIVIKGEEFTRVLEIPLQEGEGNESDDPFWLSSGPNLVTARVKFNAPETGLYTFEARYYSPGEVRWVVDGCLRAITCPMQAGEVGLIWTDIVALHLQAGLHELDLHLPPRAGLDQLRIQQRAATTEEYLAAVAGEGFKVDKAADTVNRRRAIAAAIRLRSLFNRWKVSRCKDTLVALEQLGALIIAAAGTQDLTGEPGERANNVPMATGVASVEPTDPSNPIFPSGGQPTVSSPIKPED